MESFRDGFGVTLGIGGPLSKHIEFPSDFVDFMRLWSQAEGTFERLCGDFARILGIRRWLLVTLGNLCVILGSLWASEGGAGES